MPLLGKWNRYSFRGDSPDNVEHHLINDDIHQKRREKDNDVAKQMNNQLKTLPPIPASNEDHL